MTQRLHCIKCSENITFFTLLQYLFVELNWICQEEYFGYYQIWNMLRGYHLSNFIQFSSSFPSSLCVFFPFFFPPFLFFRLSFFSLSLFLPSLSLSFFPSRYYFKFPNNLCQQVWPSYLWSKINLHPLCHNLVHHWFNCCPAFWSPVCFQRHSGE